jgi:UDP:flavonoid glycosyltransferase YjiC (YdhE family)
LRIVFSTWGSLGDLHPYLALALELQRRGHDTAIATLGAWRDHVARAGVRFHPIRPDVPQADDRARALVRRALDAREGPRFLFEDVFAPAIRDTYDDTLAAVRADGGADLLVTHQVPVTGPIVAQVTGVKWVSAVLLPMAFLSVHDPPTPPQAPALRRVAALHPSVARGFNWLARRITRPWMKSVYGLRAALGLPPGGNPAFEGQHSPLRVLGLFSPWLARKQPDFPPQALVTGFPFYDAAESQPVDPTLERFLDEGEPPIVFTLGSSAVWLAGDFYQVSIAAAKALGRRAVLLAGEQAVTLRQAGLPPGVTAVDYAPHSLVMPRASVIVHQGGVGTTAQAMRAGRPALIVPFGQDQPDNARRAVSLGIARTLSRSAYGVPRLVSELNQLSRDSAVRRQADAVGRQVRAERGAMVACDAIEQVLHGAV